MMGTEEIYSSEDVRYKAEENTIQAYKDDEIVGEVSVTTIETDVWLDHVEVIGNVQRRGIGSELIKKAKELLGLNKIACVKENSNYSLSLSILGEKLIAKCISKGIVTEDMCVFPGQKLSGSYLESGAEDPGLSSNVVATALLNEKKSQPKITEYFSPKIQEANAESMANFSDANSPSARSHQAQIQTTRLTSQRKMSDSNQEATTQAAAQMHKNAEIGEKTISPSPAESEEKKTFTAQEKEGVFRKLCQK